jgi:D-cysteine desulfhydrase
LGLGVWPTPLHRAQHLESALGINGLYVKRDDLSGFSLAGNKARKLEFLVGDALNNAADVIIAMGGPGSNLCQAAAVAARVAGIRCELVMYGTRPRHAHANMALAEWVGAELVFTDDPQRESVEVVAEKRASELAADGHRPYMIPRGGATAVGAVGYYEAVGEVSRQLADLHVVPEAVVVAVGSGGTIAGLVAGIEAGGHPWRVLGASVSRPPDEVERRVHTLASECAALIGTSPPKLDAVEITDARGPGFGLASKEGTEAAQQALSLEGLLLDPVYTAKSMAAVPRLGSQGPILWWHTGGTVAALQQLLDRGQM